MAMGYLEIVQLLASYHTGLLAAILLTKRQLVGLTAFCIIFSLHMATNLGVELKLLSSTQDITSAYGLLYGPAFYLFVRGICVDKSIHLPIEAVHLLPAFMIALWRPDPSVAYMFGFPSLFIYVSLSVRLLFKHGSLTDEWRADDLNISLHWVRNALIGFVALTSIDIARTSLTLFRVNIPSDAALASVTVGVVLLLSFMVKAALRHNSNKGALPEQAFVESQAKASEDLQDYQDLFSQIEALMTREELWREPRLSLADLSEHLGAGTRDISRAINTSGNASFSLYVNGLRVAAINALMSDNANHDRTLIDLAYDVGFNSKSAFNRHYRALTGQSPSEAFKARKANNRS